MKMFAMTQSPAFGTPVKRTPAVMQIGRTLQVKHPYRAARRMECMVDAAAKPFMPLPAIQGRDPCTD
jgi:hypothetical protein